mmetsp:Transcript_45784/g.131257  ORF Transcript_45784/g.131257 Transcript_45784/m.131257 type:complete len:581 (+) Transcript_45784:144-1886(+)
MTGVLAQEGERWQEAQELRTQRLRADLEERLAVQEARALRASKGEAEAALQSADMGKDTSKYWVSEAKGPVIGGQFVPREPYNLLRNSQTNDYDTAYYWQLGHSWMCNFGLVGQEAEAEEPRARVLLTQTTPAIVLFELNSLATFNMLDPVIGLDIDAMHTAVSECLMNRSRHSSNYPVSYVLQGVGPHFCPGGNHHPVSPVGGTPFQMSPFITSIWNVRFREHAIPGITAIQGSAVGGGVAISTNTTQRVAVANSSMAFGNLSRGASPLMWLSGNLVDEVGMANAVSLYLTDATVSAYGALKSGLIMGVGSTIANTKNRAMLISRSIACSPAGRLVANQHLELNTHRFAMEAMGFGFNSKSGSMFANVKKGAAAHETAPLRTKKPLPMGHSRGGPLKGAAEEEDDEDEEARYGDDQGRGTASGSSKHTKERPRPFPERVAMRPVHVSSCDTPCARCGTQGTDGTIYGDFYYCDGCWPRVGRNMEAGGASVAAGQQASSRREGEQRTRFRCTSCSTSTHSGQWGAGMHASEFFCNTCWRRWSGGPSDVSTTDNDNDSGTDATIINSDCVSATDGSDTDWQ